MVPLGVWEALTGLKSSNHSFNDRHPSFSSLSHFRLALIFVIHCISHHNRNCQLLAGNHSPQDHRPPCLLNLLLLLKSGTEELFGGEGRLLPSLAIGNCTLKPLLLNLKLRLYLRPLHFDFLRIPLCFGQHRLQSARCELAAKADELVCLAASSHRAL